MATTDRRAINADSRDEVLMSSLVTWRRAVIFSGLVTALVAYQLYRTAASTGNYEGLWFSLLHTLIVAVGTVCALRPSSGAVDTKDIFETGSSRA